LSPETIPWKIIGIAQETRGEMQELANIELGYVVQWTNEEQPGHRGLRVNIQQAFHIDYTSSNIHVPEVPARVQ
jgi:hypothetical protein